MTTITRRQTLALAAGAAASACAPGGETAKAGPAGPSLDALAREKGMRFGTAISYRQLSDPRYLDIVRAECGVLVSENEHKMYGLYNNPAGYSFEQADALVEFGEKNDLLYRGHTLLWNRTRWTPQWVNEYDFGADPRAEAERMLTDHIRAVCDHYGERIYSWDVVNETVDPETGGLSDSVFTQHIGPEVVDIAFHTAKEAAPHAQLVYNDYMAWEHWSETHRNGVLRHLEEWLSRGVPIDALGVQSHLGTNNNYAEANEFHAAQEAEWRFFMDEVAGMGLDILITELDVHDKGLPGDIAERDRIVADYTRAYLDLMLDYPQTKEIVAWGMVDSYSWLNGRFPREDGLEKRPAPYDSNYAPKPLREAIAAAIKAASARP